MRTPHRQAIRPPGSAAAGVLLAETTRSVCELNIAVGRRLRHHNFRVVVGNDGLQCCGAILMTVRHGNQSQRKSPLLAKIDIGGAALQSVAEADEAGK